MRSVCYLDATSDSLALRGQRRKLSEVGFAGRCDVKKEYIVAASTANLEVFLSHCLY